MSRYKASISNQNQGGGSKLQGLAPNATHYFNSAFTGRQYSTKSGDGKNRFRLVCMNQLAGGVGRGRSQFNTSADGVPSSCVEGVDGGLSRLEQAVKNICSVLTLQTGSCHIAYMTPVLIDNVRLATTENPGEYNKIILNSAWYDNILSNVTPEKKNRTQFISDLDYINNYIKVDPRTTNACNLFINSSSSLYIVESNFISDVVDSNTNIGAAKIAKDLYIIYSTIPALTLENNTDATIYFDSAADDDWNPSDYIKFTATSGLTGEVINIIDITFNDYPDSTSITRIVDGVTYNYTNVPTSNSAPGTYVGTVTARDSHSVFEKLPDSCPHVQTKTITIVRKEEVVSVSLPQTDFTNDITINFTFVDAGTTYDLYVATNGTALYNDDHDNFNYIKSITFFFCDFTDGFNPDFNPYELIPFTADTETDRTNLINNITFDSAFISGTGGFNTTSYSQVHARDNTYVTSGLPLGATLVIVQNEPYPIFNATGVTTFRKFASINNSITASVSGKNLTDIFATDRGVVKLEVAKVDTFSALLGDSTSVMTTNQFGALNLGKNHPVRVKVI